MRLRRLLSVFFDRQHRGADTLVVAVSGGVDSMVLIDELRQLNRFQLILVHVNHHLRSESDQDEELVRDYATQYHLPLVVKHWYPTMDRSEAAARTARYQALADVLQETGTDALVLGHHQNDQVETLLMKWLRGTSFTGLGGMQDVATRPLTTTQGDEVQATLYRPLLSVSKEELYQQAKRYQIPYLEDASNQQSHYLRNQVRHQLIPVLEAIQPNALEHLCRTAAQMQLLSEDVRVRYQLKRAELVQELADHWTLSVVSWRQLYDTERSIFLAAFFEQDLLAVLPQYNHRQIDALERLILSDYPNQQLDLGKGYQAIRHYDTIKIRPKVESDPHDQAVTLPLNKWIDVPFVGRVGLFEASHPTVVHATGIKMPVPADYLPLTLRHRLPGDRLRYEDKGQWYHKKISRWMIDQKWPTEQRHQAWLIGSNQDVLWLLPDYYRREFQKHEQKDSSYVLLFENETDDTKKCYDVSITKRKRDYYA